MAAAKHPGAPKEQSLGTRCGKLLNKLDKLEKQRDAKLKSAPLDIQMWYQTKRDAAIANADADVLERLGLE